MKTFKSIHVHSCFDFDHSGLPSWQGAVGPWRKISDRPLKLVFMGKMNPDAFKSFCDGTLNGVVSQDAGNGKVNVWIYA